MAKPKIKTPKLITKTRRARLKYYRTLKFPRGFLWGTSTSAHQIEGNNVYNDWWHWEHQSKRRPNSDAACNHYKMYKKDITLMKELNQNAYRFSIEWSRIEPKPGQWDRAAVRHYRSLLMELKKNGIQPFVTLHHFTNPQWFTKEGGWPKRWAVYYFCRYVKFIVEEVGDLVEFWVTVNEPLVYVAQSFLDGIWPPAQKSYWLTFKAYKNLTRAHRKSYKIIHKIYRSKQWTPPKVGIANNCVSLYSYKIHSFHSWLFILISDWLWNHSFFTLSGRRFHDFIGVNYYFHYRLKEFHFKTFRFFTEAYNEHREMSQVGWEIYPQGIFDVLIDMRKYKLPIYVTENGVATDDEYKRSRYLVAYIKEVYHAILSGVKIKGYFYWSLLDNFEWEKGFKPRFGLVRVNFNNFKRSIESSGRVYAEIAKNNCLSRKQLKYLGYAKKS
jgi:beta-glucosidase